MIRRSVLFCLGLWASAAQAQDILDFLGAELPEITDWAGTVS